MNTEKKALLGAEYTTLQLHAETVRKTLPEKHNDKEIWYELLTNERYYKNCKSINRFALMFLNRSINECIVEAEVSSIEAVDTKKRHLKNENTEKHNFISTNGPHPLMAQSLVDDFLTNHFGANWHFTIVNSKWFVSKTVDKQFAIARSSNNTLA